MVKRSFFLFIITLAGFFLFGGAFMTSVFAQASFTYDVYGGSYDDYLMPHGYHSVWTVEILNTSPTTPVSGTLEATYEPTKFVWIFEAPFTKVADGLLRYNYSLGPGEAKTVFWRGALGGSESNCVPINRVTSYLYNNGSQVATETEVGFPLSDIYLTIKNQTGDAISVTPYVNGYQNFIQSLAVGESRRVKIWEGGIQGGPLFDCSRPPSYSFSVTGVPGANYTCSVVNNGLTNNCTSEHTATCTKTTSPTPDEPTPTEQL